MGSKVGPVALVPPAWTHPSCLGAQSKQSDLAKLKSAPAAPSRLSLHTLGGAQHFTNTQQLTLWACVGPFPSSRNSP